MLTFHLRGPIPLLPVALSERGPPHIWVCFSIIITLRPEWTVFNENFHEIATPASTTEQDCFVQIIKAFGAGRWHLQNKETKEVLISLCLSTSTEGDTQFCLPQDNSWYSAACGKFGKGLWSKVRWSWVQIIALRLSSCECSQDTYPLQVSISLDQGFSKVHYWEFNNSLL